MTVGQGPWEAALDTAMLRQGIDRPRRLAEICLRAEAQVIACDELLAPSGGLAQPPAGVPPTAVTRAAARELGQLGGAAAPELRIVAAVFSNWAPQPSQFSPTGEDERPAHRSNCEQAVAEARELGNPLLLSWVLQQLYHAAREENDWPTARAAIEESTAALETVTGSEEPLPFTAGTRELAASLLDLVHVLASLGYRKLALAARASGNLAGWTDAAALNEQNAAQVADKYPSAVLSAYRTRASLARALGDRDTFRRIEEETRVAAQRRPDPWQGEYLFHASYNANSVRDYDTAAELLRQRFLWTLGAEPDAPDSDAPPAAWAPTLERLVLEGSKDKYNRAANAAYDRAAALFNGGATSLDEAVHDEATAWVSLAELVWRSWGRNGLWACRFLRARLDATHPRHPQPEQQVPAILEAASNAQNPALRRNALERAAQLSTPGDLRVLDALDLALSAPLMSTDRGRLVSARAHWRARAARSAEADGQGQQARANWEAAAADAREAVALLHPAGSRPIQADQPLRAWWALADASRALGEDPEVRREALRQATACTAQLLVDASSIAQRERLAGLYAPLLRLVLEEAVLAQDVDTVDLLSEAVRRDSLGPLLADLARRADTPDAARASLERQTSATNADPNALGPAAGTEVGPEAPADPQVSLSPVEASNRPPVSNAGAAPNADEVPSTGNAGTAAADSDPEAPRTRLRLQAGIVIAEERQRAAQLADEHLGLVSALADVGELSSVTGAGTLRLRADLLEARQPVEGDADQSRVTALLQLLPTTLALLRDDSRKQHVLVRRLTILDRDGRLIEDRVDQVPLPDKLLLGPTSHGSGRWLTADPLLPEPLLDLLARHGGNDPLRLLLVPSGLYHLHIDALLLEDERGRSLLDAAETTLHTSLAGAQYQLRHPAAAFGTSGAQLYDTKQLKASKRERDALHRHFPPGVTINSRADLDLLTARVEEHAVLGMAVHGGDDEEGWGQAKQLPNGDTLTAAEVFGLRLPPLVVMASCNSQIATRRGLDLAGFPLALAARGARSIVAGVSLLDDQATGQIMQRFFDQSATGATPVSALRLARLEWINERPARRSSPDLWGRLITYGDTHH